MDKHNTGADPETRLIGVSGAPFTSLFYMNAGYRKDKKKQSGCSALFEFLRRLKWDSPSLLDAIPPS